MWQYNYSDVSGQAARKYAEYGKNIIKMRKYF